MLKLIIAFFCTTSCIAHAQPDTCLEGFKGDLFYGAKISQNHVLSVQAVDNEWKIKRPANIEADKDKLFKGYFVKANILPAKPMKNKHISLFGSALFTQYLDKHSNLKGVRFDCGLVADEFYLVKVDLSEANQQLIENMIIMKKAFEGDKNYLSQASSKEINEMRKQKYFSGTPFHLESVTSGVISFMLQK
jgi:hypothetical protein